MSLLQTAAETEKQTTLKPGNKCTCPQDFGKCEGKAKVKVGSRTEDARYVKNFCSDENECVFGVEQSDLQSQNFLDAINSGFFKATSVISYNRPFDVAKDEFELKISLDDTMKDIVLPVQITRIKMLYSGAASRSELLISDIPLNIELNSIGQEAIIDAGINLEYKPSQAEEIGSVKYSIDYSFTKKISAGKNPDGSTIYNTEVVRSNFKSATKPVFFFKSG